MNVTLLIVVIALLAICRGHAASDALDQSCLLQREVRATEHPTVNLRPDHAPVNNFTMLKLERPSRKPLHMQQQSSPSKAATDLASVCALDFVGCVAWIARVANIAWGTLFILLLLMDFANLDFSNGTTRFNFVFRVDYILPSVLAVILIVNGVRQHPDFLCCAVSSLLFAMEGYRVIILSEKRYSVVRGWMFFAFGMVLFDLNCWVHWKQ